MRSLTWSKKDWSRKVWNSAGGARRRRVEDQFTKEDKKEALRKLKKAALSTKLGGATVHGQHAEHLGLRVLNIHWYSVFLRTRPQFI